MQGVSNRLYFTHLRGKCDVYTEPPGLVMWVQIPPVPPKKTPAEAGVFCFSEQLGAQTRAVG